MSVQPTNVMIPKTNSRKGKGIFFLQNTSCSPTSSKEDRYPHLILGGVAVENMNNSMNCQNWEVVNEWLGRESKGKLEKSGERKKRTVISLWNERGKFHCTLRKNDSILAEEDKPDHKVSTKVGICSACLWWHVCALFFKW